jgi:hypothetical protein
MRQALSAPACNTPNKSVTFRCITLSFVGDLRKGAKFRTCLQRNIWNQNAVRLKFIGYNGLLKSCVQNTAAKIIIFKKA